MDKVLSMRVVKKEVRDIPPPARGGGGRSLPPALTAPPPSPQLPSGQLTESEEFFVKYKN